MAATILSTSGCEALIGLDEPGYVVLDSADAGGKAALAATTPPTAACQRYCSDAIDACSVSNAPFVDTVDYGSMSVCLKVCPYFEPGDLDDPHASGNTLACRKRNASLAKNLNRLEQRSYCPAAGPGGGAPGVIPSCGSNCESYCDLYQQICDPELDLANCVRRCGGLHDTGTINAQSDFSDFPDTVQCRIAHLSVAAFTDPAVHCHHARLVPEQGAAVSCDLGPEQNPNCADYCKLVGVACSGASRVYESSEQCLRVCASLRPGLAKETAGNSLACRRWRAYAALLDPATHCPSAGPVASGPCGDACDTHCDLLARTCQSSFEARYGSGTAAAAQCQQECAALPFDNGYSVELAAQRGGLSCRALQLARALAGNTQACASAAGASECN